MSSGAQTSTARSFSRRMRSQSTGQSRSLCQVCIKVFVFVCACDTTLKSSSTTVNLHVCTPITAGHPHPPHTRTRPHKPPHLNSCCARCRLLRTPLGLSSALIPWCVCGSAPGSAMLIKASTSQLGSQCSTLTRAPTGWAKRERNCSMRWRGLDQSVARKGISSTTCRGDRGRDMYTEAHT